MTPIGRRPFALALASVAVAGVSAWRERPAQALAPQPARWPALPVHDLAGQPLRMPSQAGRARLINVWARWCEPCRRELPSLQRLAAQLAAQQVEVVALAIDDDAFALREYVTGQHLTLAVLRHAPPGRGVPGAEVLPQTFAVAPDGRVLARWTGARAWDQPGPRAEVQAVLRAAGAAPA